jgi:hypothetical protein
MYNTNFLHASPFFKDKGQTVSFMQTDSEDRFLNNKVRLGSTWEWYNKPITYQINALGYRMNKEIAEVNFNRYIASFGCSFVVGIGMPLNETFTPRLAEYYQADYINAAIGGAGIEWVVTNLIQLLTTVPVPPKMILINWPDAHRGMYWYESIPAFFIPSMKRTGHGVRMDAVDKHWAAAFETTILEQSHIAARFRLARDTVRLICKTAKIPLIETGFSQLPYVDTTGIDIIRWPTSKARDVIDVGIEPHGGHPGIEFHNDVYNTALAFCPNIS